VSAEFGYGLAFTTGVFGALHCLGMCGGLASGCAAGNGSLRPLRSLLQYHGGRILLYTLWGVAGALAGRVLVQTGFIGKGQGLLMICSGLLVIGIGARMALHRSGPIVPPRFQLPVLGGVLNGLVPCSLVFSVAIQAAAAADPVRAGLLMLSFGLGTLPTMATVSILGGLGGQWARGPWAALAGFVVAGMGVWTAWEGWTFYDIMRGLADW
jgi:sulfite exporter TauE/SafE